MCVCVCVCVCAGGGFSAIRAAAGGPKGGLRPLLKKMKKKLLLTAAATSEKNLYGLSWRCSPDPSTIEIGTDEVARGPLFGRVYAAAVVLWPSSSSSSSASSASALNAARDSKKVPRAQIAALAAEISLAVRASSVRFVEADAIDETNIRRAVLVAMRLAVSDVRRALVDAAAADILVVADGCDLENPLEVAAAEEKEEGKEGKEGKEGEEGEEGEEEGVVEELRVRRVIGGDGLYVSVACASILAKAAHGAYILDLCARYPELSARYKLERNMGYGTHAHMAGLREHGATYWHRQSCAPVRMLVDAAPGSGDAHHPLIPPAPRGRQTKGGAAPPPYDPPRSAGRSGSPGIELN